MVINILWWQRPNIWWWWWQRQCLKKVPLLIFFLDISMFCSSTTKEIFENIFSGARSAIAHHSAFSKIDCRQIFDRRSLIATAAELSASRYLRNFRKFLKWWSSRNWMPLLEYRKIGARCSRFEARVFKLFDRLYQSSVKNAWEPRPWLQGSL